MPHSPQTFDEEIRRRDRLERDRVAATLMEPGLPEFHGPGAAAAAAGGDLDTAAGALEGGTEGKKQALVMFADKILWKSIWAWPTALPSLAGLNLAAAVSKMEGWPVWKKVALIFLDLLATIVVVGVIALFLMMMCFVQAECRSQILPWYANIAVNIGLWWINL